MIYICSGTTRYEKDIIYTSIENSQRVSTTFLTFSAVTEQQSGKHQSQTNFLKTRTVDTTVPTILNMVALARTMLLY